MNNRRLILLVIFGFSLIQLYSEWQVSQLPKTPPAASTASAPGTASASATGSGVGANATTASPLVEDKVGAGIDKAPRMVVQTDRLRAEISSSGGDIVRLELLKHGATEHPNQHYVLFDDGKEHLYLAQSGFLSGKLVDHKTVFSLPARQVDLKDGQDSVTIRLAAAPVNGVKVSKVLTFHRGSYLIDVGYELENSGSTSMSAEPYFRFARDDKPAEKPTLFSAESFTGPAIYDEADRFKKYQFKEIAKASRISKRSDNGWVAMVQHYFVAAYLPKEGKREFFAEPLDADHYATGVKLPAVDVEPGQKRQFSVPLYAGPQDQKKIKDLAPGFERVVDYGIWAIVAQPLFVLLSWIYKLVGNWGWAIILLTVLVKLLFFPLSAASYRSMAKMGTLMPQMKRIQEQYADDNQKKSQAMMELYKREKVNPMGGCWPMLIQIPVFLALYWVLLSTVEMREAPWLGWITDLSAKDPYYILPIIMGVTSVIQTRLNPKPADPIQAKVMTYMPIAFTFMFLWFPSGLVLYWIVNNTLSIAQQWYIKRMFNVGGSNQASA